MNSINAMKETGMRRSIIAHFLEANKFPDELADCLSQKYILYWSAAWLNQSIKNGKVVVRGKEMNASFHCSALPAKIKKDAKNSPKKQYVLSIRVPKDCFDLPATARIFDSSF